jgi:hypothetical protein
MNTPEISLVVNEGKKLGLTMRANPRTWTEKSSHGRINQMSKCRNTYRRCKTTPKCMFRVPSEYPPPLILRDPSIIAVDSEFCNFSNSSTSDSVCFQCLISHYRTTLRFPLLGSPAEFIHPLGLLWRGTADAITVKPVFLVESTWGRGIWDRNLLALHNTGAGSGNQLPPFRMPRVCTRGGAAASMIEAGRLHENSVLRVRQHESTQL